MMARAVLLDTCAAIWLMNGDRMSAQSRASVAAAQTANLGVYVSPMTAWEIATLVSKNRLRLSLSLGAWFDALLGFTGVRLAAMPPRVLIASAGLPGAPPRDPVDRIIAATGRTFGYAVVTRSGDLMRYARAGHIEAIEC
jgi:PIN domain nuclease of toxin-antitoxin system